VEFSAFSISVTFSQVVYIVHGRTVRKVCRDCPISRSVSVGISVSTSVYVSLYLCKCVFFLSTSDYVFVVRVFTYLSLKVVDYNFLSLDFTPFFKVPD